MALEPRPVALHDDDAQLLPAGVARERGFVFDEHGLLEPRDLHLRLDLRPVVVRHLAGNYLSFQGALDLDASPGVRDAVGARGDPRQRRVPDEAALVRYVPQSLHRQGERLVLVFLPVRDEDVVQGVVIEFLGHALRPRAAFVALEWWNADGRGCIRGRDKFPANRVPLWRSLHPLRSREDGSGCRMYRNRRHVRRHWMTLHIAGLAGSYFLFFYGRCPAPLR